VLAPAAMNPELANYCRCCRDPRFAFAAAGGFVVRCLRSGLSRLWPGSARFSQPAAVKRLRRSLLRTVSPRHDQAEEGAAAAHPLPGVRLALTGQDLDFEGDWSRSFPDEEVTSSLHRWGWLLRGLTEDRVRMSRERGLALMRSWLRHHAGRAYPQGDAYSIGERVVNGSLFLLLTGDGEVPTDICAAFGVMARQIAANLEYYAFGHTGNHAFNNSRGLLFAGVLAKLPAAVDLALAIARERLPKLVTADGFMREGSSHYHFLFTRWVLEMLWLAERVEHQEFVGLLRAYGTRLVARCWFFLVPDEHRSCWQIPLIGDVSPDSPPAWLLGLPWSAPAVRLCEPNVLPLVPPERGWSDLFGATTGSGTAMLERTESFPRSGWIRVNHPPWTVFVRAETRDGRTQSDHSHHDLGSFVLYRDGVLLFLDSGRVDYTRSPLSLYGMSARAHNSLLIDGLGASCDGPAWLSDRYRKVKVDVRASREMEDTLITIEHDGFGRIAGHPIAHRRSLRLTRHNFRIEDHLDGNGTHRIQVRLHFAAEVQRHSTHAWMLVGGGTLSVPACLPDACVQSGQTSQMFGGLVSSEYGRVQAATTLDLSGTVSLPAAFACELAGKG